MASTATPSRQRRSRGVGRKDDHGKLKFELIPDWAMEKVAEVYTIGAIKYGAENWRGGMKWSRLFGAMLRHGYAWKRGHRYDAKDRQEHLAAVVFCAMTLMEYEDKRLGEDDRPCAVGLAPEYIAGVIDSDGYVCFKKVGLTQTKRDLVTHLSKVYGGTIHTRKVSGNPRAKQAYEWQCPAGTRVQMLTDILPFLVLKKDQAMLVCEAHSLRNPTPGSGGRRKRPAEVQKRLDEIEAELRKLNERGLPIA